MKKNMLSTLVFAMVVVMPYVASASWVKWTDTWTPDSGPIDFSDCQSAYTYTHDITNHGFVVGRDEIKRYSINISLRDDQSRDGKEWAFIGLPGYRNDKVVEVDMRDIMLGWSLKGLFNLNASGILDVTVYRLWGDFELLGSELITCGKGNSSAVPLPASLVLMGSGLFGLASFRLRRKKRVPL